MAVEGTYTQDCARWQLKGHSWQDVKNGETFSTKNSALRLYSSIFIYINVFTDFRIHKTRKSQRMVDCCVFVTISYYVTLLPLQIHVMGKAEDSKTKVKRAISKWNKNEIFQNTLLALFNKNANVRHTATKAHKIRNKKWGACSWQITRQSRKAQTSKSFWKTLYCHAALGTLNKVKSLQVESRWDYESTNAFKYYNLGSNGGAATLQITNVRRARGGRCKIVDHGFHPLLLPTMPTRPRLRP